MHRSSFFPGLQQQHYYYLLLLKKTNFAKLLFTASLSTRRFVAFSGLSAAGEREGKEREGGR